jgi:hypothetical protein
MTSSGCQFFAFCPLQHLDCVGEMSKPLMAHIKLTLAITSCIGGRGAHFLPNKKEKED